MVLDEEIRKHLLADHGKMQKKIREFLEKRENYFVLKERYLEPTHAYLNLPLDDPRGDIAYFSRLRNMLEIALTTGRIQNTWVPEEIPHYVRALIEK